MGDVVSAPLILVVDDYDDAREMYAAYLGSVGYRVVEASDGQQALDMIAKDKPALVVMDLAMPVVDGWTATKTIKSDAATADIIVLAVTGHATESAIQKAVDAGADRVLAKPCAPDKVRAVIEELLRARLGVAPRVI